MTYPPDQNNPQSSGYPGYPAGGGYPGNYPGGYPASTPPGGGRLRGRRPSQVGGILMIVGLVLVIVGGVIGNTSAYSKVNGFQRVAVKDGTGTVTFKNAGGYVAYYESDEVRDSKNDEIRLIDVTLTNQATGQSMKLTTLYGNRSGNKIKYLYYDRDGHKGHAMYQFHIDETGTYKVELQNENGAPSDTVVAFGKSIAGGLVLGGVLVIIGVLLLLAGLIVLIVGLVKRRRHKRELREGFGYGGPGSFGGYGGAQPAGLPPAPQTPQPGQTWPPPPPSPSPPDAGPDQPGWPPAPEPPRS